MQTSLVSDRHAVQKVRHTLKARLLQVRRIQRIGPYLLRVTLAGDELAGFVSASFDDHVKLFLPVADGMPVMPTIGPQGPVYADDAPRPVSRDYTPRRYDADAGELDIDFVLHGHGPAASWAAQAAPGQYLGVAGPRGSFVIPHDFDWHLLIGDETALPAIARRLEELPRGKRVLAVIETRHPAARIALPTQADLSLHWVHDAAEPEDGPPVLERVVRRLQLPDGEGYVWAAGESAAIRGIRQYLVQERGIDKSRIRAASYWRRGDAGAHEVFGD
ncbi:siderophore-interacting protein [Bordetella sp. BOR01]|uniref:siderophore-interacting protein n=1 Tax=Bordetella sp. BOR01 TaxID=2854779 RepID=UPI001C465D69|nr:siderophore-interacting protein [Bordetella sp. BOR01]MBV7483698.1 siderophore-interacting protein [Bordetella sp. BOR01]